VREHKPRSGPQTLFDRHEGLYQPLDKPVDCMTNGIDQSGSLSSR